LRTWRRGDTHAVSVDDTDYASDKPVSVWKRRARLSEAEALNTIAADGVSTPMATVIPGKAPMPLAVDLEAAGRLRLMEAAASSGIMPAQR